MFRLALILLSGAMFGYLLGLVRRIGVARACGFDGVRRGVWPRSRVLPMFRLARILSGAGQGLMRSIGVAHGLGFDGARRRVLQVAFPQGALMFRLALILLSGAGLLGLGRSFGMARACGFDRARGVGVVAFPQGRRRCSGWR